MFRGKDCGRRIGIAIVAVVLGAVTLGACRGGAGQTPLTLASAELAPMGGSGLAATAGFAFTGDHLGTVTVEIQSGSVGSGLDARIVDGDCDAPGRLVVDIGALEGPQLITDIPVGQTDVVDTIVVLVELGTETPLACGPIRPAE
jgi:hypothetical protein